MAEVRESREALQPAPAGVTPGGSLSPTVATASTLEAPSGGPLKKPFRFQAGWYFLRTMKVDVTPQPGPGRDGRDLKLVFEVFGRAPDGRLVRDASPSIAFHVPLFLVGDSWRPLDASDVPFLLALGCGGSFEAAEDPAATLHGRWIEGRISGVGPDGYNALVDQKRCPGPPEVEATLGLSGVGPTGVPRTLPRRGDGADPGDGPTRRRLSPRLLGRCLEYLRRFEEAQAACERDLTDRQAYEWLTEEGPAEDGLPLFETWMRYLRQARRLTGAQKKQRRCGGTGRSVVRARDEAAGSRKAD